MVWGKKGFPTFLNDISMRVNVKAELENKFSDDTVTHTHTYIYIYIYIYIDQSAGAVESPSAPLQRGKTPLLNECP